MVIMSWVNLTTLNETLGVFNEVGSRRGVSFKGLFKGRPKEQCGLPLRHSKEVLSRGMWEW